MNGKMKCSCTDLSQVCSICHADKVRTKMYHGTAYKYYDTIRKFGITPRSSGEGNWDEFPSRSDMVYLTTTYPFFFSVAAENKEDSEKIVVFETELCNLDYNYLYPDEDFVYQVMKMKYKPKIEALAHDLHVEIKEGIEKYREMWLSSIINMGNCAYQDDIHPTCFSRCCIVDLKDRSHLAMEILNPSISIMNHRLCGERYRDMIAWFFGDIPLLPQVADAIERKKQFPDKGFDQAVDFWIEQSENREGIKVEYCQTWKDVWGKDVISLEKAKELCR